MKQKHRYRKKPKGSGFVTHWPAGVPEPDALALRVKYRGSSEHKARPIDPSFDVEPALRSDASQCMPEIERSEAEQALRRAVRSRVVSEQFEGIFPRYAWAVVRGRYHIARLINREAGEYKGWPIEDSEVPVGGEARIASMLWGDDV